MLQVATWVKAMADRFGDLALPVCDEVLEQVAFRCPVGSMQPGKPMHDALDRRLRNSPCCDRYLISEQDGMARILASGINGDELKQLLLTLRVEFSAVSVRQGRRDSRMDAAISAALTTPRLSPVAEACVGRGLWV